MTTKISQLESRRKNAKVTLIVGVISLLITPVIFFLFALIGTATCPLSDVGGGCEFDYSIMLLNNSILVAVLWAAASVIAIISGVYRLYVISKSHTKSK